MRNLFGLVFLLPALATHSQDTMSRDMDEVYIYSSKFAERKKNIVQRIEIISAARIAQANAQNTGDLLINTGNVYVQKSQQGGSSPVIRGFEASRVLLVVDGIRMNNAIYRAGHLQNVITVDQNMLERVEVLYGPSSTLYGSDALGGVMHFRTRQPQLATSTDRASSGNAFVRYSSANHEKTAHSDFSIGGKKFAWLQSFTYSDFDDMKMGKNYPDNYPSFGSRPYYVEMINGIDSVVKNEDSSVQKFSGYRQWDILQKLLYKPSANITHLLNFQYSNSSNVPRYDRLQDVRGGKLRYAEWYYGPQLRVLGAYELNIRSLGFLSEFRSILSYQHIEESRHQRDYRKADRLNRYEDLDVLALTLDGRKLWSSHELSIGMDVQLNTLESTGTGVNINTLQEYPIDSRYPNGNNNMNYFGIYAQHLFKWGAGKWVLNDGLRLQVNTLHSTLADNSFFNFPFTDIQQNNAALTGNLGIVFTPRQTTRVRAGLSTGFRSPNIDDLARIFESSSEDSILVTPNPDIKPEYTYNFDLAVVQQLGTGISLEIGGYYTLFRNAIALAPFTLNGQDSVLYNGVMSAVFANQNVNRAYLYGFHVMVNANLLRGLNLNTTINYTYGRQLPEKGGKLPMDHIPPVYGKTSLNYTSQRLFLDLYALYNGWKKIKDYSPSGEDNPQYATPEGMPAWVTLNLKTTLKLNEQFTVQAGVENILDRNYRYFASGFSAPGRNWIVALRANF